MNAKNNLLDLLDNDGIKNDFFMEEEVELKTKEAKRAMKNYFKHIQVRSSAATLLLIKFGQESAAKVNQDSIDGQLDHFLRDMNQDIQHSKQVLDDAGISTLVSVTGGIKGLVKITSPTGFQFLNLLKRWDVLNIHLVTLYMRQEIGQQEVIRSTHQWGQRLKKFNALVENLSITAYKATDQLKRLSQEKEIERKKRVRPTKTVKPAVKEEQVPA